MCTAVTYRTRDHYFGRNLDLELSYGEAVAVTPRNAALPLRRLPPLTRHHAFVGMAHVSGGFPLYYDGVNECGLAMAALNFPHSARYTGESEGDQTLAPFEVIPWVLGRCATADEAAELLAGMALAPISFSPKLPHTPLHWMAADRESAIVIEPLAGGLSIRDNPVGVLTNEPPFEHQMYHLALHMGLSPQEGVNRFAPELDLERYSRGLGAVGLPGDLSSPSRFVRAAFTRWNSVSCRGEEESVSQVFHILASVSMARGCLRLGEGAYEITRYSACCNTEKGLYYYTTYDNPQITAVDLRGEDLEGSRVVSYPLRERGEICWENRGGHAGGTER